MAQTKPVIPERLYAEMGIAFVNLARCSTDGLMPARLARLGNRLLSEDLDEWAFDEVRLRRIIERGHLVLDRPDAKLCSVMASPLIDYEGYVKTQWTPTAQTPKPTPQLNARDNVLREDQERTNAAREAPPPLPQESAWQKFLREDGERISQERAERAARLEQADADLLHSDRGGRNASSLAPSVPNPYVPAQPKYLPQAVYPASA